MYTDNVLQRFRKTIKSVSFVCLSNSDVWTVKIVSWKYAVLVVGAETTAHGVVSVPSLNNGISWRSDVAQGPGLPAARIETLLIALVPSQGLH